MSEPKKNPQKPADKGTVDETSVWDESSSDDELHTALPVFENPPGVPPQLYPPPVGMFNHLTVGPPMCIPIQAGCPMHTPPHHVQQQGNIRISPTVITQQLQPIQPVQPIQPSGYVGQVMPPSPPPGVMSPNQGGFPCFQSTFPGFFMQSPPCFAYPPPDNTSHSPPPISVHVQVLHHHPPHSPPPPPSPSPPMMPMWQQPPPTLPHPPYVGFYPQMTAQIENEAPVQRHQQQMPPQQHQTVAIAGASGIQQPPPRDARAGGDAVMVKMPPKVSTEEVRAPVVKHQKKKKSGRRHGLHAHDVDPELGQLFMRHQQEQQLRQLQLHCNAAAAVQDDQKEDGPGEEDGGGDRPSTSSRRLYERKPREKRLSERSGCSPFEPMSASTPIPE